MAMSISLASLIAITIASLEARAFIPPPGPQPWDRLRGTRLHHSGGRDLARNWNVGVDVAGRVHPSVALVTPVGVRNMTARGSGFVIDAGEYRLNSSEQCTYLITAAHVAAPGFDICLSFPGEGNGINTKGVPAAVVARNQTLDLALLRIDAGQPLPSLALAEDLPPAGAAAFSHGFPASRLRGGPAITSGIVCGIADGLGLPGELENNAAFNPTGMFQNNDTTTYIVTDAAMAGGMSRGPLTDAEGKVMGVNALIRPDLRALGNYAVSVEEVRSFLEGTRTIASGDEASSSTGAASFRVMLFNDRMNKKERVSAILEDVAQMKKQDAGEVMMAAHRTGKGVISTFENRTAADELCMALRREDLLVEVQQYNQ